MVLKALWCYSSLCENNDKFAIDRELPEVEKGDIFVIHDTGAHGHAMDLIIMLLRPAEYLLTTDSKIEMIRREQTMDDYFSTLKFDKAEVIFWLNINIHSECIFQTQIAKE